ncbi:hypothetical protein OIU84_024427 [Salix udensis]|uniref:Bulb-type lectin domain-containing protein n=1 Tax=Salix udensis TaxID=889485 RepID=A0AAD6KJ24_9ROSI|nr:hypothetical protein OIU84_024427 [Salix udensis]
MSGKPTEETSSWKHHSYICCGWKANGNMVLHDSRGNFSWQSFDSPTDTLLVGQSLRVGGVTRLVSRASEEENSNGSYNEKGRLQYVTLSTGSVTLLSRPNYNRTLSFLRLGIEYGNLGIYTFNDMVRSRS